MVQGQDIICFANDWDSDPLSKKHVILRLAQHNRVLWINSIGNRKPMASVYDFKRIVKKLRDFSLGYRQVHKHIHVFSPIALPFFGNNLARWANHKVLTWSLLRVCRQLGFHRPIMWTFFPSSGNVVGSLDESTVIYHCVDEYSEFTGTDKKGILELERELLAKSDCVIVSSERLYRTKSQYNENTFLVTHGVDTAHFRKACDPQTPVPHEITVLRRPIIGFFGLIADWVDIDLLRSLALARPDCSFALIGKVATDISAIRKIDNIHVLGQKTYEALPGYAKGFDIALLPFVMNELTVAANPLKLREYLAAGLPVISTAIPEADKLRPLVRIGHNKSEFLQHMDAILKSGQTGPLLTISAQMDNESWDHKVEQMCRIISGVRGTSAA